MSNIKNSITIIKSSIPSHVELVAVSKTKPNQLIQEAYDQGQRHFGENKAQELLDKAPAFPLDIKWHFIGHLQTKKVRQIIEHVYLIHSVDSLKLLEEINKRAKSINKIQDVLLQVHIAEEDSKFGFLTSELEKLIDNVEAKFNNTRIVGLMGMATFTADELKLKKEFKSLKTTFEILKNGFFSEKPFFKILSMGMSGDYQIAIQEGSTMIRVGSKIFGSRN